MQIVLISIFGVLGVLSRYSIETYWGDKNQIFPINTLVINIIGCFIAGLVYSTIVNKQILSDQMATAIIIGFCGGLTTFSGYCLQSLNFMQNGELLRAFAYIFLSVALGLITVMMGVRLGNFI